MESEKRIYYTPTQAKASKKYLTETVEEFKVRVPKGDKEYYKAIAARSGESLNSFTIRALKYLIEAEKLSL